jgi:hypothetical protein
MTSNRRWCASAISLLSCGQASLAPLIPSCTYLPAAGGRLTNLMAVFLLTAENNVQTASSTSPTLPVSMLTSLRETRPEYAIHDVFNLGVDENGNTAMRKIMEKLNIIQRDAGCTIGVIHRFTKASEGNLRQRIRGAGAIAGWAERAIGIEKVPLDRGPRRKEHQIRFSMK